MSEVDSSWDVIVIGAGLGGLSAAARLGQMGLRPLVLEQHTLPGGYAHHFLRKVRGTKIVYDFDVALHQTGDLAPGCSTQRWLSDLGVLERFAEWTVKMGVPHAIEQWVRGLVPSRKGVSPPHVSQPTRPVPRPRRQFGGV